MTRGNATRSRENLTLHLRQGVSCEQSAQFGVRRAVEEGDYGMEVLPSRWTYGIRSLFAGEDGLRTFVKNTAQKAPGIIINCGVFL